MNMTIEKDRYEIHSHNGCCIGDTLEEAKELAVEESQSAFNEFYAVIYRGDEFIAKFEHGKEIK